jgi:hypothetical protein
MKAKFYAYIKGSLSIQRPNEKEKEDHLMFYDYSFAFRRLNDNRKYFDELFYYSDLVRRDTSSFAFKFKKREL